MAQKLRALVQNTPSLASNTFTFAQYNILAQNYTRSDYFPWCPSSELKQKVRLNKVMTQIEGTMPDILCVEELDCLDFYNPRMERLGYSSIYKKRTGRKKDGCAIYYLHEKFSHVESFFVEYDDLVKEQADENAGYLRNNVGLVGVFELTGTRRTDPAGGFTDKPARIVVGCTHLFWNPEFEHVKIAQTELLQSRIADFNKSGLPVVIGGDFNSLPASKVYQSMTTDGRLALTSAYSHYCGGQSGAIGEPPFTNFKPDFQETIDYIFYSGLDFTVRGLLDINVDEVRGLGGLPNSGLYPSDHLLLMCEFELERLV